MYNKKRLFPLLLTACLCGVFAFAGCKKKEDMTMKMNEPRNIRGVANFGRTFGDRNDRQLAIAQAIGIPPIASREAAEKMTDKLVFIDNNEHYSVDSLTHSIPYLIPDAAELLDEIGKNFRDSLKVKNAPDYKIKVTSVTRMMSDVKKLRKSNINSSKNSAHLYGTTFDISWVRYTKTDKDDPIDLDNGQLKMVLASVLRDLKRENRCYVKHERRQGCFHITVRSRK